LDPRDPDQLLVLFEPLFPDIFADHVSRTACPALSNRDERFLVATRVQASAASAWWRVQRRSQHRKCVVIKSPRQRAPIPAARAAPGGEFGREDDVSEVTGASTFVLLGEATHGTIEFNSERAKVTGWLLDDHRPVRWSSRRT
jgi:hypothetical protein